ncbi:MAG TPA: putative glycoside hydrolase [Acidimicrobiales bacterium]|nr:putative glycoside hydrolase [Acidimicrobiales bacterium]
MASSLRNISGAGPGRGRRLRRRGAPRGPGGGSLGFGPRSLHLERDDRRTDKRAKFRRLRHFDFGALFAGVLGLGTLVLVIVLAYRGTRVKVDQAGLEDGAVLNGLEVAALDVQMTFKSPEDAEAAELSFDGKVVEEPTIDKATMRWRPPQNLKEGDHILSLAVPRVLLGDAHIRWDFTLDITPPAVDVLPVTEAVGIDQSATVAGKVEKGAHLVVGGRDTEVADDGGFSVDFARPPAGPVVIEVIDRAGNRSTASVVVPVAYPSTRGVHVTAAAWSSAGLRDRILQMVDEKRIDTVLLDLKDEGGVVGFDTTVEKARQIGAVTNYYDLDDAVATIEDHGARVVGRIAAFRDPVYARAAWGAGDGDQVIQTPDGAPYDAPGDFTNFASPAVQRYNLDIALDAVGRGVDDIMWDDVRQPGEEDPSKVVVPGLQGSASDAIVGFLADAQGELRRRGAYQGVGVKGTAADRGALVAQDVAQMARHADYVVPELHPAYWSSGEFGIESPVNTPGELVSKALLGFQQVTQGSGALFVPSLQDFSARGVTYGPDMVRSEIDAAAAVHVGRFILWDPSVTYTADALDPQR